MKVSRPYFSTSPQGVCEKFGLGTRLTEAVMLCSGCGDWVVESLMYMCVPNCCFYDNITLSPAAVCVVFGVVGMVALLGCIQLCIQLKVLPVYDCRQCAMLLSQWSHELLDHWANGHMSSWITEPMVTWAPGSLRQWSHELLDVIDLETRRP